MNRKPLFVLSSLLALASTSAVGAEPPEFFETGRIEDDRIDEASGLQALDDGTFLVHNDERNRVFVIDGQGRSLGSFDLEGAKNRDWEDLARVPGPGGPLIVAADIGDNGAKRKRVHLYFFQPPDSGQSETTVTTVHHHAVRYPDGPRDAESIAYDPASGDLLIMSKRDVPPRLYRIPLDEALGKKESVAEFVATVPGFRPPGKIDLLKNPFEGRWVSQPTGMDISPDGQMAVVITYRSLYLFQRVDGQEWGDAFQQTPVEIVGPPSPQEEAVAFSRDGRSVYVTTEGRPAPVWRLDLPE